jgi:tetratricopeptide (TPR) repeat protein/predicted aspartyl protease
MANGSIRILATALASVAALAAKSASAESKCQLGRYFEVPVTIEGPKAFMDVKVNGVDSHFQIDTGAFFSIVTPDGAMRLHLNDAGGRGFWVDGVGGSEDAHVATAKTFDFAGVPLKNIDFVVAGRKLTGETGLIGENLLGTFAEVDYDFGKGKIGFYKVEHCYNVDVAYWANKDGSDDWIRIEPRPARGTPSIIGTVTVNGQRLRAKFDTGFYASMMSRGAAARAGIRPDSPGVKPSGGVRGFGPHIRKTWIAPVSSFVIGHEEIKSTQMAFGDFELNDADMLLGIDFFLSHHIFVVHGQDRLYFSYNGGPVFKLDQPEAPDQPPAPAGAAPSDAAPAASQISGQTAGPAAEPADPDTLDREGAALMARHEFESALKAFARAAELDPKTGLRWVKRAQAELALKRPVLAMSDLDHAIELKPDDVTARMIRGQVLLSRGEFDKAQADFETAAKAAPPGDDIRLRIAAAYQRHEHWAESIPHLDAWLAVHARESAAPGALNQRGWARAMLGKDLDKALADCDAAIRQDRAPAYLDSRGLVHLRLGQLKEAIDDYDAALRAAPKTAWSLYGRGLAKKRLGQTAEGEADIQAAVALQPKLPELARRMGLLDQPPAPGAKPAQP